MTAILKKLRRVFKDLDIQYGILNGKYILVTISNNEKIIELQYNKKNAMDNDDYTRIEHNIVLEIYEQLYS